MSPRVEIEDAYVNVAAEVRGDASRGFASR
jgi:hypothetical protein